MRSPCGRSDTDLAGLGRIRTGWESLDSRDLEQTVSMGAHRRDNAVRILEVFYFDRR